MKNVKLGASGCGERFIKEAKNLGFELSEDVADIRVIGERDGESVICDKAKILFCPDGKSVSSDTENIVSAGMGERATLSFSAVNYESGLLSVKRNVDFLGKTVEPQEIRSGITDGLSLYENIVLGFLKSFG